MYSKGSVEASIRHYYRGAIHECGYAPDVVEELLNELDFDAITKALDDRFWNIAAYEVLENGTASPDYSGHSLFRQNAARIYRDNALCTGNPVEIEGLMVSRAREVWLQEDGNVFSVDCTTVYFLEGEFQTNYREIVGVPFRHGEDLNLRLMTDELKKMCIA